MLCSVILSLIHIYHATKHPRFSEHWIIRRSAPVSYTHLNLLEDGYYQIQNAKDKKYITVSGSNTFDGTSLYLTEYSKKLMQDFAVYFDSDKYQYKEADIFAATYRTNNLKLMGAQ